MKNVSIELTKNSDHDLVPVYMDTVETLIQTVTEQIEAGYEENSVLKEIRIKITEEGPVLEFDYTSDSE